MGMCAKQGAGGGRQSFGCGFVAAVMEQFLAKHAPLFEVLSNKVLMKW
jgi:hypothetical protein